MIIVMKTTTSEDSGYNADYDFSVVKLELHEAKQLQGYFAMLDALRAVHPEVLELVLECEDLECEFYNESAWDDGTETLIPEELEEEIDKNGWAVFPDGEVLPFTPRDAHSPAGLTLIIGDDGFYWRAYPNHDVGTIIETHKLGRDVLQQIV